MKIEILPDHHIHSKASRCCPEQYTLKEIVFKLRELNAPYACITDHIHYAKDDQYYFQHMQLAKQLRLSDPQFPIFLGAEMTIQDSSGHLPELDQAKGNVQFTIVGEHFIPNFKITMDDLEGGRTLLKEWIIHDSTKLSKAIRIVKEMYLNCIKLNHPTVLVHPYSTYLRCDYAHSQFLSDFEEVCELSQNMGTAIELNESQRIQCLVQNSPQIVESPDVISKKDFFIGMIRIMKHTGVKYSLGSDSHVLKSVGHIEEVWALAQNYGLSEKKHIDLRDMKN